MGTKERKVKEKLQRREAILKAARKLFWSEGFSRATMPGIARACELAPGTLYLYFPSKEALYLELLLEGYGMLIERLRKASRIDGEELAMASSLIDAFLDFAKDSPQYFDIIFFVVQRETGSLRCSSFEASQIERIAEKENQCKSMILEALSMAAGGKGRLLDSSAIDAEALWSMLAGVALFWRNEEPARFNAVAGRAKAMLLAAISAAVKS